MLLRTERRQEKENKKNKEPASTGLGLAESRLSTQAREANLSPALPRQKHPAPCIQPWHWDSSVPTHHPGQWKLPWGPARRLGAPQGVSTASLPAFQTKHFPSQVSLLCRPKYPRRVSTTQVKDSLHVSLDTLGRDAGMNPGSQTHTHRGK